MKSTLKKLPKSQVELGFEVPTEQLEKAREAAYQKLAPQVKVAGFRPGKAPRHLIEQQLNPSRLMQEALDQALNEAYQESIKEHEIVPVAQPEVDLDELKPGQPIKVKAKVPVRPEVKLGDYKKIKVKKEPAEVTDEKVQETLQTIFERTNQQESASHTDNPAEPVLVDTEGKPLTSAKEEVKPDAKMDDEWAKKIGAKSLDDLRSQVRQDLESQAKYEAESKWQEQVLDKLIEMTKTELPEVFVADELRRMQEQFAAQLRAVNMSLEQYLQQAGKSNEDLEQQWRPQAEKQATLEVALAQLANQENITVSDEEIDQELANVDGPTRARFDDPEQRYLLQYSLWRQKVMKHLLDVVGE